ncbi:MAG TPA: hypothetical protein VGZ91_13120 [Candidatus Sulfotelmatobacter sp.]|jgi:hypothetical protein|nr:hypothetical protein [Candidatus Sulfotelmatobacter sp.]
MMRILGKTTDQRTKTRVVYTQMTIDDYLDLVGEHFDEFAIQRRRERHRGYDRLKRDVMNGALLPTITLAYDPNKVGDLQRLFDKGDDDGLAKRLQKGGHVKILDGLQRTFILADLRNAKHEFNSDQYLLVEFWLEQNPQNLIYRIIVLNAGQKPMSMRHQLEILFATFKSQLEDEIPELELLLERESSRRKRAGKYAFDKVVVAYQAFLIKGTEVTKENVVAQSILEENILSGSEEELNAFYRDFTAYLAKYVRLDQEACRVYDGTLSREVPTGLTWFGGDNVMLAFFAAIADFSNSREREKRTASSLKKLTRALSSANPGDDPLGLANYQRVVTGFNPKKINVGFATRKLLFRAFKEFFREDGEKPLGELWVSEAE